MRDDRENLPLPPTGGNNVAGDWERRSPGRRPKATRVAPHVSGHRYATQGDLEIAPPSGSCATATVLNESEACGRSSAFVLHREVWWIAMPQGPRRERPKQAMLSSMTRTPRNLMSGRCARKRRHDKRAQPTPSMRKPKKTRRKPRGPAAVIQAAPARKRAAATTEAFSRKGGAVVSGSRAAMEARSLGVGVASGSSPLNSYPQSHTHLSRGVSREHFGHRFIVWRVRPQKLQRCAPRPRPECACGGNAGTGLCG